LSGVLQGGTAFVLKEDMSQVGGGAYPLQELPTIVVAIKPPNLSVNGLQEILRRGEPPIITRISKDELILDMRTVFDDEIPLLAQGLEKALRQLQS
jgi:L-seryl-tRNA(Ser) seleniumtransferase